MIEVFWWSKIKYEDSKYENFGDYLVPFLLEKFTNQKFKRVEPNTDYKFRWFKKKHYFIIGSILSSATSHTIVWGAGIIKRDEFVQSAKFLLVRGPLTRKRLLSLGYAIPEKYGDPALLLALLNQNKTSKKFKLGIVPHYVDFEKANNVYKNEINVTVIDLCTNNPQSIIDSISDCDFILSSSLHGLIVSHTLNIPALWVKISNKLYGDDVKFQDYYESLDLVNVKPIEFKHYKNDEIHELFSNFKTQAMPSRSNINKLITDLVETFPFKKSVEFKRLIKKYFSNHE